MRHLAVRSIGGCTFVISLLAALILGCSTLPPAQPAEDLKSIVGKWEGRGRDQKLGDFFITLRISQDGTCRIDVRGSSLYEGPSKFSGTASVYEGKFWFRSDIPWMNGSATLYKGEKEHLLVFISDDASTKVDLQLSFR